MKLFLYELKEKWDKKYVYIIYFLLMLVLVGYEIFCYLQSDFLLGFQTYQRSSIILFAGMMFLAYEIFCDLQKKDWRELISLKKNGFGKILIAKNMLSVLFVIGVFLVVFIITAVRAANGVDLPVWKNAIRVLLLNFAVLPLMGAELGKMFALVCKKRWSGYLGILILILLSAGVFQRISQALYLTVGVNLDWIFRFFQFTQPISQLSLSEIKELLHEDCDMLSIDAEKFDNLKYMICLPTSVTIDDTWANEMIVDDCLFVGVTGTTPQNADDYAQEILENSLNVEGEKDFLKEIFSSVLKSGKDSYLWDLEAIDEKEFLSISYDKTVQDLVFDDGRNVVRIDAGIWNCLWKRYS